MRDRLEYGWHCHRAQLVSGVVVLALILVALPVTLVASTGSGAKPTSQAPADVAVIPTDTDATQHHVATKAVPRSKRATAEGPGAGDYDTTDDETTSLRAEQPPAGTMDTVEPPNDGVYEKPPPPGKEVELPPGAVEPDPTETVIPDAKGPSDPSELKRGLDGEG